MRASGGVSSPCWVGRPVPRGSGLTRSLATCCGSETTGSAPGGPGHDDAARAAERRPQRRSKSSSSTSTAPKTGSCWLCCPSSSLLIGCVSKLVSGFQRLWFRCTTQKSSSRSALS